MLPDLNSAPVEEFIWMKREELMREFESIRLIREARLSNPGWIERAYVRLGQLLMKAGQHLYDEYTASRPIYVATSAKFAA